MLIWPRIVCGRTACQLAHLVVCVLVSGGSTGALLVFLFNMKWRCYAQAGGAERVKVLPLLGGFSCKVYLQRLSKILL
jgi:hypothetical protein